MGLCSFLLSYVATIFLLETLITDQEGSRVALDLMHTKGMIKDRKFILLSYKMHFLNNSLKKERKDLRMSKLNVVITKRAWGASCLWIIECCSHDKSFFMWIFAIFPSLHHGTKNPKTNTTTTQACGSSLFCMLSHPNGSGEAHCAVMSWGNFLLAKLQVNM